MENKVFLQFYNTMAQSTDPFKQKLRAYLPVSSSNSPELHEVDVFMRIYMRGPNVRYGK